MLTKFRTEIAPRATLLQSVVSGLWRRHGRRHRRADDFALPPHLCLLRATDTLADRSCSVGAAIAGAAVVGAVVAACATAETRLVAPAGVLCANAALYPPLHRDLLPAAQIDDAAK